MKNSLKIINIIEKSQGWSLSRLLKASNKSLLEAHCNVYIFTGSVKWLQAPQLLSLYLLIVRLGRFKSEFKGFKKIADLETVYERVYSTCYNDFNKKDVSWFNKSWKWWSVMMDNHKELFFKRKLSTNYCLNHSSNGINDLIRGGGDDVMQRRWQKIIGKKK